MKSLELENQILKDPYLDEERVLNRLKNEYKKYGKLIIAYDFDYTLNSYRDESWEYPEVIQLLKDWKGKAHFICYTASSEERYPEIIEKTRGLGVPLDYINKNVPGVNVSSSGKIYYSILLDDRSGLGECVRVLKRLLKEI